MVEPIVESTFGPRLGHEAKSARWRRPEVARRGRGPRDPGLSSLLKSVLALFPGRYLDVGQAAVALTGADRARPAEEQLERVPRERRPRFPEGRVHARTEVHRDSPRGIGARARRGPDVLAAAPACAVRGEHD